MVRALSLGVDLPKVPKFLTEYTGTPVRDVDLQGAIQWTGVWKWVIQGRAETDSGTTGMLRVADDGKREHPR
jgi:hypothetical protein